MRRAKHLPANQVPRQFASDARSAEPSIFPTLSHPRAATTGPARACMAGSAPQRAGRLRKPLTARPSPYGPMPGRGPRAARPQPTPRPSAFPTNRCPSQGKGSPRGKPAAGWFSPRIAKEEPALSIQTSARISSSRRRRIAGGNSIAPSHGSVPQRSRRRRIASRSPQNASVARKAGPRPRSASANRYCAFTSTHAGGA